MSKKAAPKKKQEPQVVEEQVSASPPQEMFSDYGNLNNSSDAIEKSIDVSSYIHGGGVEEMMRIYKNIYDKKIRQNNDQAAEIMIQRLKKQLQDDQEQARTKDTATREQKASEIQTFSHVYVDMQDTNKAVQNYFADQLISENLLTKCSVLVKSEFETIAHKVENDIKEGNNIGIPVQQLDLRDAIGFLEKGYTDVLKRFKNDEGKAQLWVKYQKDNQNDKKLKKNARLSNRIKNQEARAFVYDMEKQRRDIVQRREDKIFHLEHDEEEREEKERLEIKQLKKKEKQKRIEACKIGIAERKEELQNRIEALKKYEDTKKKSKKPQSPRVYKVGGRKFRKADKQFYKERLQEIHEAHKPIRLEGDIDKHQEKYENDKKNMKHYFDANVPVGKKLNFYNSELFIERGKDSTAFPDKDHYKNDYGQDVAQQETEIEQELEAEFDSAAKEEKLNSLKGKSLRLYLYHKQKIAASKFKQRYLNPEFDNKNTDNLYKGLPHFEKLAKEQEHKDKIEKRIEMNKSLPSLHLKISREFGKKGLEKQKKDEEDGKVLKTIGSAVIKLPEIKAGNKNWYPNYLKSIELRKSSNPQKRHEWKDKYANLNKGSLQRQIADVENMDKEIHFRDLTQRYGVKSTTEPNNQTRKLDSFVQSGVYSYNTLNPNNKNSGQKPESVFFDSMKTKVAILNQLLESDEDQDEKEDYGGKYKRTAAHKKFKQRQFYGDKSTVQTSPNRYDFNLDYGRSPQLEDSVRFVSDSQDFGKKRSVEKTLGKLIFLKIQIEMLKMIDQEVKIKRA